MANTSNSNQLRDFVREQYRLWNEGRFADLIASYQSIAPNGLTLEYVGRGVLPDGWKALQDMCDTFGATIRIEVLELIVNGDEAAAYAINNQTLADGGLKATPSIDLYRLKDGKLECRYFHA